MRIEFISLKMKNILSYGSSITTLEFGEGLNAIVGVNGQGKSSFLDALSFNLFGSPYRKITLNELINRVNGKQLWTESIFKIGSDVFKVTRSLKPASLTIEKNNDEFESLSSKKLDQVEIDKILGINHKLFRQIICLAVNYNKPFLSLGTGDKRDIIESIFNIKVFADMLKSSKNEQSGLKIQSDINKKNMDLMFENIKSLRSQIKDIKHARDNFDLNKKTDIEKINSQIDVIKKFIISSQKNIDVGFETLDDMKIEDVKPISDKLKTLNGEVSTVKYRYGKNKKDIDFLNNNIDCPFCKSKLTEEHKEQHLQEMVGINTDMILLESSLLKEINNLEDKLNNIEKQNKLYSDVETHISKEKQKIEFSDKRINDYMLDVDNVKIRKFEVDIPKMETNENNKTNEYNRLYDETELINKDIVDNDIIANVLSDKGIKAFFFNRLLPILNSSINEYLKLFEMPISLEFDDLLKEVIIGVKGSKLSYMGFSEGEKQRINISILLSFIDTTKIISNWDTNLIFFDELFDTGVDSDGLEKIMEAVKTISDEDPQLCMYIISHKIPDDGIFKNKIEVAKVGDFSKVKFSSTNEDINS